jgi:FeS assembly SUF system protein
MDAKPQSLPLNMDRLNPEPKSPPVDSPSAPEKSVREKVIEALQTCYDPEVPVNIYELGLIYDIQVAEGQVHIKMTLTSPACPVAGSLPGEVQAKIMKLPGVTEAKIDLVWEPPWDKDRMSEAAQLQLGLM